MTLPPHPALWVGDTPPPAPFWVNIFAPLKFVDDDRSRAVGVPHFTRDAAAAVFSRRWSTYRLLYRIKVTPKVTP